MNKFQALIVIIKCFVVLMPFLAEALTCTSLTGSVNWTTAGSWTSAGNCNRIPTAADSVIIPNGSNVTLTAASNIANLTVQSGGTLTLTATGSPMPTVSGSKTFDANSTVAYNGNNNQTISAETYGNLSMSRTSGNRIRTLAAGNITIQGDLTINTNTTWRGNTNNPNVTIYGNITRIGTFTSGSGTYTFSGSTTQTISATITATNVVVSNTSTQGLSLTATHTFTNFTLSPNAILTLAGSTTAFPTTTTRNLDSTSTVQFSGTGNQTIPAITYGNLITATSGTKTPAAGTHNITGSLSIGTGTTYAGNTSNPTININGSVVVDGTLNAGTGLFSITNDLNVSSGATLFLPRITGGNAMPTVSGTISFDPASTVNFSGAGAQNIPQGSYGSLTISGSGNKTPLAGTFNIAGNFNITAGTWLGSTNNPDVYIAGNITRAGTFTSGGGNYIFNGSTTQTINATCTFTNLRVENTSTNGLSVSAIQTITNLTIASNAVMKSTVNLTITNITMDSNSALYMEGTTSALSVAGTQTLNASSAIWIAGTGNQTIPALNYGSLVLSNGGIKTAGTALAQTINISGNFTLNTSTTYNGTTRNPTVNIAGDFTNTGTFNSGTGVYTFNGSNLQNLTGATTFTNLSINNTATLPNTILNLNNDVTIVTLLNFIYGGIYTGTNKVIMSSGASVSGASGSTGWVVGNLQKFIPAGSSSNSFEIGTLGTAAPSLAYSPLTFSVTGVAAGGGSLIASTTSADHPLISTSGLDSSKNINRWWSLSTSGVTGTAMPAFTSYDATFNFVSSDVDIGVNTSNLFPVINIAGTWTLTSVGTRNSTSTQSTGNTSLGEFAIGQPSPPSVIKTMLTLSDPINGTTNPKAIPGSKKEINLIVTNTGLSFSSDSCIIKDNQSAPLSLFVNDIGGSGSGPVIFTQGIASSGLSFNFVSLSSNSDDIDFSNDNGATWNYSPTANADGCDPNVTNVRVNPKGVFSSGISASPQPSFELKYHACLN